MAQSRKCKKAPHLDKHLKDWHVSGRTRWITTGSTIKAGSIRYQKERLHPPESPSLIELRFAPGNEKQPSVHHTAMFQQYCEFQAGADCQYQGAFFIGPGNTAWAGKKIDFVNGEPWDSE